MTSTGRGALILGILLVTAAVLLAYPEPAVVGVALCILVLGHWLLLIRRPALEAGRTVEPHAVTRGDTAHGHLIVRNRGRLSISARPAADLINGRPIAFRVPRLPPGATVETSYELPTSRRGVVDVGPVELVSADALGLVRRVQRLDGIARLFVRPRAHVMCVPQSGRTRTVDGGEADRALEGSVTFHALREYVPGDDRRRVHWRTSARTGKLMVKQHVDLTRPEGVLVLDVDVTNGSDEAFEEAVDVVASLGATALRGGDPVRLITSAGETLLLTGPDSIDRLLDTLATVARVDAGSLVSIAPLLSGHSGSVACVVSAGSIDAWLDTARTLVPRFGTVALASLGRADDVARSSGVVTVSAHSAVGVVDLWNAQVAS